MSITNLHQALNDILQTLLGLDTSSPEDFLRSLADSKYSLPRQVSSVEPLGTARQINSLRDELDSLRSDMQGADGIEALEMGGDGQTHHLLGPEHFHTKVGDLAPAAGDLIFAGTGSTPLYQHLAVGLEDQSVMSSGSVPEYGFAVPVGSILLFAGTGTPPTGFLYCDGSYHAYDGSYSRLYDVIGYDYGISGTDFRLPNCVNVFPRLVDKANRGVTGGYDSHGNGTNDHDDHDPDSNEFPASAGTAVVLDSSDWGHSNTDNRPAFLSFSAIIKY